MRKFSNDSWLKEAMGSEKPRTIGRGETISLAAISLAKYLPKQRLRNFYLEMTIRDALSLPPLEIVDLLQVLPLDERLDELFESHENWQDFIIGKLGEQEEPLWEK